MIQENNVKNFQAIVEKLTPDSQIYLLNMANMAKIAELGKKKEIETSIKCNRLQQLEDFKQAN